MRHTITQVMLAVAFLIGLVVGPEAEAGRRGKATESETSATRASTSVTTEVDADNAAGGLRYRIKVAQFNDKSSYMLATGSITSAWSEMLTQALHESGKFLVVAGDDARQEAKEEILFGQSDDASQGKSNPQKGHLASAQLLVRGTIVSVQETGGSGISTGAIGIPLNVGKRGYEIRMIVEIFETQTGLIVASREIVGKSSDLNIGAYRLPGNTSVHFGKNKNLAKAASKALDKTVEFCSEQLSRIEWLGAIMAIRPNGEVLINRGEREGITPGKEFEVGLAVAMNDPETGEMLGYDKQSLARIQVIEVNEKYSVCSVISGKQTEVKKEQSIWLASFR